MRERVDHFWELTNFKLIVLTAIFFVLFDNYAFFKNLVNIYPVQFKNIIILSSIAVMLTCTIIMLFSLLCHRYTTKPFLIIILLISSLVAYFMNNYNIVIDEAMIKNIIETDTNEVYDLLNVKLFIYLALAGILPSIIILKIRIRYKPFIREFLTKIAAFTGALLICLALIFFMSDFYSSFFREQKQLRYYSNPLAYVYSVFRYIDHNFDQGTTIKINPIGTDARISKTDGDRELIILVVGETARADRFSLNGYNKETNPLLKKEDVINFPDVHSCGTTSAVSVSCMFSILTRDEYSRKKADSTYNILDILNMAGVNILWRDNNSDSKGVALRVPYENYKTPEKNTVCNPECRDEGMLVGLQEYIDSRKTGDILIVLHQMGNHGPAYYKRYPESFEKFKPVCKTNQFEKCTSEEINNAYDNAILYTDYFLSKVIALLKQNNKFETAMFYIGDHGESLGENNIYLHGMPYFMAPDEQIHVPAIMWFGDDYKVNKDNLKKSAKEEHSQDYLFNTLLSLMEVETTLYDKDRDIIHRATNITPVENIK
jgi:lipid A ethanolaminephosphotransferase